MLDTKETIKQIQLITYGAYGASGQVAALLEEPDSRPEAVAKALENTAARLEANAPGGTIYISRAVADCLEGRIAATSLGDAVKLKGKTEGFEVLTLDKILDQRQEGSH